MSYNNCCNNPFHIQYDMAHTHISNEEKSKLVSLLWYLPEVESYQAKHKTVFADLIYDDFLFTLFVKSMSMSEEDIYIEENKPTIERTIAEYYKDSICVNCQKIQFRKRRADDTKIQSLFKNIRDIIAHGCFNIVGDYFIGFNHPHYGGQEYTALIKVRYDILLRSLNEIISLNNTRSMFEFALHSQDYNKIDTVNDSALLVEKSGVRFWLEFKKYSGRYIDQVDIEKFINEKRHIDKTGWIFVLVVDSTYTNNKINAYVVNEHIAILDRKFAKEILEGKDVLMEIAANYLYLRVKTSPVGT